MISDKDNLHIDHNKTDKRFEIRQNSHFARLLYYMEGDAIVFSHTAVPGSMRGQDVGNMLVRAGLEYARINGLKVIPLCPFVSECIRRMPEYQDLLKR